MQHKKVVSSQLSVEKEPQQTGDWQLITDY
jgi:hypothetical protein